MRTRFIPATVLVALCVLAIFAGKHTGVAFANLPGNGACKTNSCVNITGLAASSGSCAALTISTCVYTSPTNNIVYCDSSGGSCSVISPPQNQTCSGYCAANAGFGCSTIYNKCQ